MNGGSGPRRSVLLILLWELSESLEFWEEKLRWLRTILAECGLATTCELPWLRPHVIKAGWKEEVKGEQKIQQDYMISDYDINIYQHTYTHKIQGLALCTLCRSALCVLIQRLTKTLDRATPISNLAFRFSTCIIVPSEPCQDMPRFVGICSRPSRTRRTSLTLLLSTASRSWIPCSIIILYWFLREVCCSGSSQGAFPHRDRLDWNSSF